MIVLHVQTEEENFAETENRINFILTKFPSLITKYLKLHDGLYAIEIKDDQIQPEEYFVTNPQRIIATMANLSHLLAEECGFPVELIFLNKLSISTNSPKLANQLLATIAEKQAQWFQMKSHLYLENSGVSIIVDTPKDNPTSDFYLQLGRLIGQYIFQGFLVYLEHEPNIK